MSKFLPINYLKLIRELALANMANVSPATVASQSIAPIEITVCMLTSQQHYVHLPTVMC